MTANVRTIGILCAALLCGSLTSAMADECKKLKGELISEFTSEDCASPVGLCSRGVYSANHGLNGALERTVVTSIGGGPSGALNPDATISYSTDTQLVTPEGTVMGQAVGIFDSLLGRAASFGLIVGGTGRYAGATGHLYYTTSTRADGKLVAIMTGELCLP